jgi:hypothetical protein
MKHSVEPLETGSGAFIGDLSEHIPSTYAEEHPLDGRITGSLGSLMIETEPVPQTPHLSDQLTTARDILTAHPLMSSSSGRVEPNRVPEGQGSEYLRVADGIFDTLGVDKKEVVQPWDKTGRNLFVPREVVRLRRAADVASTAAEFSYDPNMSEADLRATTKRMVDTLRDERARAVKDHVYKDGRTYAERIGALTPLVRSAVSELGRRNGLGDSLTIGNLLAIEEQTSVPLVEERHGIFSPVIPIRRQDFVHEKPAEERRPRLQYYIPELGGWKDARRGGAVLDARYTNGRLPR